MKGFYRPVPNQSLHPALPLKSVFSNDVSNMQRYRARDSLVLNRLDYWNTAYSRACAVRREVHKQPEHNEILGGGEKVRPDSQPENTVLIQVSVLLERQQY